MPQAQGRGSLSEAGRPPPCVLCGRQPLPPGPASGKRQHARVMPDGRWQQTGDQHPPRPPPPGPAGKGPWPRCLGTQESPAPSRLQPELRGPSRVWGWVGTSERQGASLPLGAGRGLRPLSPDPRSDNEETSLAGLASRPQGHPAHLRRGWVGCPGGLSPRLLQVPGPL